jgi:hypothetical protein
LPRPLISCVGFDWLPIPLNCRITLPHLPRIHGNEIPQLSTSGTPYLFGPNITEADIRLYPTIARFDVAYVNIFLCNLKMIRYDYPLLSRWLRRLYWNAGSETNGEVFGKTTFFDVYKRGYLKAKGRGQEGATFLLPKGPEPDIFPLEWEVSVRRGGEEKMVNGGGGEVNRNGNGTL